MVFLRRHDERSIRVVLLVVLGPGSSLRTSDSEHIIDLMTWVGTGDMCSFPHCLTITAILIVQFFLVVRMSARTIERLCYRKVGIDKMYHESEPQ